MIFLRTVVMVAVALIVALPTLAQQPERPLLLEQRLSLQIADLNLANVKLNIRVEQLEWQLAGAQKDRDEARKERDELKAKLEPPK